MGKYRSTHTGQEIDTGVTKALNPDSVPSSGSSALITSDAVNKVQQGFAPIETASAAANNYAVDDLLVYNGVLYKAKTAIYNGDLLVVGTNIEATTIANKLNNVDTQITANTDTTLTGLLKGNGSKVSAEQRYVPTITLTKAQYEALVSPDPNVMYVITDDDSDVASLAPKTDLAAIQATGSTNATGSTIPSGTYFYLNGILVQALADIASGATFTSGTNYSSVTAGGLNSLKSALTAQTELYDNSSYPNVKNGITVQLNDAIENYRFLLLRFTGDQSDPLYNRFVLTMPTYYARLDAYFTVADASGSAGAIQVEASGTSFQILNVIGFTNLYLRSIIGVK